MTPGRTILCVHHATRRADRVSRLLAEFGFDLAWVNPARGDPLPADTTRFDAMVVYGGEHSVNDDATHVRAEQRFIEAWLATERPYLGLCLGAQFLARALGARVSRPAHGLLESGFVRIEPVPGDEPLFDRATHVFQWHNEGFELPRDCQLLATGTRFPNQAFRFGPHAVGLQFHPEVTPEIMLQWFHEGGHMLTDPGARSAESQLRDAAVFTPQTERWTRNFLARWLNRAPNAIAEPVRNHA